MTCHEPRSNSACGILDNHRGCQIDFTLTCSTFWFYHWVKSSINNILTTNLCWQSGGLRWRTQYHDPLFNQCWFTVHDTGRTLVHYCVVLLVDDYDNIIQRLILEKKSKEDVTVIIFSSALQHKTSPLVLSGPCVSVAGCKIFWRWVGVDPGVGVDLEG